MESLKTYFESILDKTSEKVKGADKVVKAAKKEFMQKLKSMSRHWLKTIDDTLYQEICEICDEIPSEEKKGKAWEYFLPDEQSDFHPIAVSYAHCVRRVPTAKEFCGTTESAVFKRLKSNIKKHESVNEKLLTPGVGLHLRYFMLLYDKTDTPSGNGWYTIADYAYHGVGQYEYILYSVNPDKYEWCYGCPNGAIPSDMVVNNNRVAKTWTVLSNTITNPSERNGELCGWLEDDDFNILTSKHYLKEGSADDYKKSKGDWLKVYRTRTGYGSPHSTIYVNRKTLEYLSEADVAEPINSNGKWPMTITAEEFSKQFKQTGVHRDAIFSSRKALMEEIYSTGAPIYCNESYYVHESKYHRVIKVGDTFQCGTCKKWEDWRECHYYSEYVDKHGNKAWIMTGGRYD